MAGQIACGVRLRELSVSRMQCKSNVFTVNNFNGTSSTRFRHHVIVCAAAKRMVECIYTERVSRLFQINFIDKISYQRRKL
jgi:hypothetical protein